MHSQTVETALSSVKCNFCRDHCTCNSMCWLTIGLQWRGLTSMYTLSPPPPPLSSPSLKVVLIRDGQRTGSLSPGYVPQAVAAHPTQPEVAIGGKVGRLMEPLLFLISCNLQVMFVCMRTQSYLRH